MRYADPHGTTSVLRRSGLGPRYTDQQKYELYGERVDWGLGLKKGGGSFAASSSILSAHARSSVRSEGPHVGVAGNLSGRKRAECSDRRPATAVQDAPSETFTRAGVPARSRTERAPTDAGVLKTRAVRDGAPAVCTATAPPRRRRAPSLALAATKQRSAPSRITRACI